MAAKFFSKLLNFEQKQCRIIRNFLAKNITVIIPQPPYLPDLAPCDFFRFPKLKKPMKGKRFATIDDIKSESKKELVAIPKRGFQKCFENWKKRWHKCMTFDGDYFEGEKIDIDE